MLQPQSPAVKVVFPPGFPISANQACSIEAAFPIVILRHCFLLSLLRHSFPIVIARGVSPEAISGDCFTEPALSHSRHFAEFMLRNEALGMTTLLCHPERSEGSAKDSSLALRMTENEGFATGIATLRIRFARNDTGDSARL